MPFILGSSFIIFDGKKLYYDSRYGLAGYQRIHSTHQNLINITQIFNPEIIIDIGANVGFFSLLCRYIFPHTKIFAFEPIPQTFTCLKKNFKTDKKTKIFNFAISNSTGKTKMNFNNQNSAISQITSNGNVTVHLDTLDNFVKRNKILRIDLLKIDTESFEAHVLKGGTSTLEKTRYIFIEITMEKSNHNYTISSLLKLLSTKKYDFQLIGFRNYSDSGEGEMPIMDAVLKNIKFDRD